MGTALGRHLPINTILALYGDLGMGKTTLTRGIAHGIGVKDTTPSSPTFAIVHEHKGDRCKLYHFDMYRILEPDDLFQTGFFDYIDTGCIIVIEWSENIEYALPDSAVRLTISKSQSHRIFELDDIALGREFFMYLSSNNIEVTGGVPK